MNTANTSNATGSTSAATATTGTTSGRDRNTTANTNTHLTTEPVNGKL